MREVGGISPGASIDKGKGSQRKPGERKKLWKTNRVRLMSERNINGKTGSSSVRYQMIVL